MHLQDVFRSLPHRYPMLLVDRVVEFEPPNRMTTIKAVSCSEPWYRGLTSPTAPALEYPSALVLESWCQSAALLALTNQRVEPPLMLMLGRVADVKFHVPVLPGDVIKHRVELGYRAENTFVLSGEVLVAGEIVTEVGSVVIALRAPADGGDRE